MPPRPRARPFPGRLCRGHHPLVVSSIVCSSCNMRLEGDFEVSSLARLRLEDQAFVLDETFNVPSPNELVLDQLARGEITVDEAIERLNR